MKATVKETESWKREISIEIPTEQIDASFNDKLKEYKKTITLPGFRKGKVPTKILKGRFGESIKAEVIDGLVNDAYRTALKDNDLSPIAEPKINDLKVEDDEPITFNVELQIDPEVEIKDYKDLGIAPEFTEVTDEDVQKSLDEYLLHSGEIKESAEAAVDGDTVTVEYTSVLVDGEEVEGVSPTPPSFVLGRSPIEAINEGIRGNKAGDTAIFSVDFESDYFNDKVAGKTAEITVNIQKVETKIPAEINDELFEKLGETITNEEELRSEIKKNLEENSKEEALAAAHSKAIDALIEKNPFEVPPARLEYYYDQVAEQQKHYLPEGEAPNREKIKEIYSESALRELKQYRIVDFISTAEKVKATQEEVDKEIQKMAEQYGREFEELKTILRQNGTTNRIREQIKEKKTLDLLVGHLKWEEK